MLKCILQLLLPITLFLSPASVFCADDDSKFFETSNDRTIAGTCPTAVLSYTLTLNQTKIILVAANGRYFPAGSNGLAVVNIRVDGSESYSSHSIIDWGTSQNAVQHSFDCIALITLTPGTHIIELIGYNHPSTPSAAFVIGANSGLSVITNPAPNVLTSTLDSDSPIINYYTVGIGGDGELPATTLLSHTINTANATNVVSLLSGRAYYAGGQGDALWGIYLNDQCPSNNTSNWSVNDIFSGAERHAPMYCFAMHNLTGNNTVSFKATELSWGIDQGSDDVQYRVGKDVRLISLWGMGLSGTAVNSNRYCSRVDWHCIGSSYNYGGCNPSGTNTILAETTINIPTGHNGIVFFKTATRVQADASDQGGNAVIWLNIDGVDVGTAGVQQLTSPNCESSRTIAASYLAVGDKRLTPGPHVVRVYCRADGAFIHLAATNDLPLIYFD